MYSAAENQSLFIHFFLPKSPESPENPQNPGNSYLNTIQLFSLYISLYFLLLFFLKTRRKLIWGRYQGALFCIIHFFICSVITTFLSFYMQNSGSPSTQIDWLIHLWHSRQSTRNNVKSWRAAVDIIMV